MSKVMIVNDMASMRKMVIFTLESEGREVIKAATGDGQKGFKVGI